jgi:hypothetical protein
MSANHYLIELLDPESCVQANGYKFMGEDVPIEMWAREADLPDLEELQLGYARDNAQDSENLQLQVVLVGQK